MQKLIGVTDQIDGMLGRTSEAQTNAPSVRVELQTDCVAGVCANKANASKQILVAQARAREGQRRAMQHLRYAGAVRLHPHKGPCPG